MKYTVFILALCLSFPAYAQHKTVAKPVKMSAAQAELQTGDIPLTKAEKKKREIEEADALEESKTLKWEAEYSELENLVPDTTEKIIDVLTEEQKTALDPSIKSIYDQKKIKRSQKPR